MVVFDFQAIIHVHAASNLVTNQKRLVVSPNGQAQCRTLDFIKSIEDQYWLATDGGREAWSGCVWRLVQGCYVVACLLYLLGCLECLQSVGLDCFFKASSRSFGSWSVGVMEDGLFNLWVGKGSRSFLLVEKVLTTG